MRSACYGHVPPLTYSSILIRPLRLTYVRRGSLWRSLFMMLTMLTLSSSLNFTLFCASLSFLYCVEKSNEAIRYERFFFGNCTSGVRGYRGSQDRKVNNWKLRMCPKSKLNTNAPAPSRTWIIRLPALLYMLRGVRALRLACFNPPPGAH